LHVRVAIVAAEKTVGNTTRSDPSGAQAKMRFFQTSIECIYAHGMQLSDIPKSHRCLCSTALFRIFIPFGTAPSSFLNATSMK
jgi:hypothetical protein